MESLTTPGAPNYRPLRGTQVASAQHGRPLRFYVYRGDQPVQPIMRSARPRKAAA